MHLAPHTRLTISPANRGLSGLAQDLSIRYAVLERSNLCRAIRRTDCPVRANGFLALSALGSCGVEAHKGAAVLLAQDAHALSLTTDATL